MQNLSCMELVDTNSSEAWQWAWLQNILGPGRGQSLNEWHIADKSQMTVKRSHKLSIAQESVQLSPQPRADTDPGLTEVNWKDPEPAGLDGPCRHEEILTRDGVNDCINQSFDL